MTPKRGYLSAVLVALLSVVGITMWAGCSQSQGSAQSGASAATTPAAAKTQTDSKADSTTTVSETGEEHALLSNPFSEETQGSPPSRPPVDPAHAPQAVFVETVHDVGTIDAGTEVNYAFRVKNTGKGDLYIDEVKPG